MNQFWHFDFWTNMSAYDWQHFQMHDFESKYLYFNFNFPWGKSVGSKHYLHWTFMSCNIKIYNEIITNHSYLAGLKVSRIFYCPVCTILYFLPLSPSGWRGIVVTVRAGGRAGGWVGGRAGGCQTCGTHISVTAWRIFSIRSSMELSRPVVVHCHGNLPICPIWACPWAKNLSNLPQIGSRLCGTHISETAGWIYPI